MKLGSWEVELLVEEDEMADMSVLEQVHGSKIVSLVDLDEVDSVTADGFELTRASKPAAIKTADCLPLVLIGEDSAIGIHVSRKSLIRGILDGMEDRMSEIQHAFIGPHVCEDHFTFEFMGDELRTLLNCWPYAGRSVGGMTHINLLSIVQAYLDLWSVPQDVRVLDPRCTFEDEEIPSYRRLGKLPEYELLTVVRPLPD